MSEPVALPSEIVAPPSLAVPATPAVATPAPEATPAAVTQETPVNDGIPEIDSIESISDALAVKLGEKKLKKTVTEETKTESTEVKADDPEVAEELAVSKDWEKIQREAFTKKTYENRDLKRKLKEAEEAASKLAEYQARIAELEAKATTTTAEPGDDIKAKLAEYEARLAEKEAALATTKYEATEAYQRDIAVPLATVEQQMFDLAKEYSLNERDVAEALKLTGVDRKKQLSALVGEMSEYDKMEFFQAAKAHGDLNVKKDTVLANAKTALLNQEADRVRLSQEEAAKKSAEWNDATAKTWPTLVADLPFLAKSGDPAWDSRIEAAEAFAKSTNFSQYDAANQATIMHRAAVYPMAVGAIQGLEAKVAELTADLAKYRGAEPDAGGGVKPAPEPGTDANGIPKGASFTDAINARLKAAGIA